MADINKTFGKRLKMVRRDKKLTQEKLAEKSGVDYKYIQKLEGKNPSSPTLEVIEKLAKGLNIEIHRLLKFE